MLTKDDAICIRAVDYSETSQVLTFLTKKTGRISAIAKGSKRPKSSFDGPIELFSYGEIVFSNSGGEKLAILTEFEQKPGFTSLSTNYRALNSACFAAELTSKLTNEYDPHPETFESFLQFLQNINGAVRNQDILRLLILFQLSLLHQLGLAPIINACGNCKNYFSKNWPQVYFSSSINGLLCQDCEGPFQDKIKITAAAAGCLSNLKTLSNSVEKVLNEIEKILVYHFTEILGKPPKMAKYLLKY